MNFKETKDEGFGTSLREAYVLLNELVPRPDEGLCTFFVGDKKAKELSFPLKDEYVSAECFKEID